MLGAVVVRSGADPDLLGGLLAGPGQRHGLDLHGGLLAVHGLLEASLLLGLEEWVIVERIRDAIAVDRHGRLELGIAPLELEMILDHTRKN